MRVEKLISDVLNDAIRELEKDTLKMWYRVRDENRVSVEAKEWSTIAERNAMVRRAADAQAEIDMLLMKMGSRYDKRL